MDTNTATRAATTPGMRIVSLEAENIQALRAVALRLPANMVQVRGKNGAGKTSLFNAIFWALAGKDAIPSRPIRRGEDSAVIRLDLGDIRVTRRFRGDDDTDVIVESQEGARFPSPQRMLSSLIGKIAFDPVQFSLMEPKKQLDTLRSIVKLDVDITALDQANERDFIERKGWNAKVESLKARTTDLAGQVDPAMEIIPIDVEALTGALAEASAVNAGITDDARDREQRSKARAQLLENAMAAREQAAELIARAESLEQRADIIVRELAAMESLPAFVDVASLRDKINAAMRTNAERDAQARVREQHRAALDELQAAATMAQSLTEAIRARIKQKESAIASAAMPVPGLGFGSDEVLFNGVPLAQASAAERIRVSVAIAMAINPKLRVAFIRDGSLLDEDSLSMVATMAEENDFQVFVEQVGTSGAVGILIQDGSVAAIDGVPVPAPESVTSNEHPVSSAVGA